MPERISTSNSHAVLSAEIVKLREDKNRLVDALRKCKDALNPRESWSAELAAAAYAAARAEIRAAEGRGA